MNVNRVAEIFTAAGTAFNRLGELTAALHPDSSDSAGKWTDEEIDMLRSAITHFSEDLNKISLRIKNRTASQIRQNLKKKAFEEAGLTTTVVQKMPVLQLASSSNVTATTSTNNGVLMTQDALQQQQMLSQNSSSEVMMTLNRLNAQEVDVESLDGSATDVKLEFEVGHEDEVTG